MTNRENGFLRISKAVAEDFLQSTIVIDDMATLTGHVEPDAIKMKAPATRPSVGDTKIETEEEIPEVAGEAKDDESHQLNAKIIIDSFASKKIICSVIKPDKKELEGFTEKMTLLAASADIVVIDWSIHEDDGGTALKLIGQLIASDLTETARLRLVAIYTIDGEVAKIPDTIKKYLDESFRKPIMVSDDKFSLTLGSTRIVILSKPGAKVPEEYKKQEVPFGALADRLTSEFASMTAGLVSNVVLSSLAEVRKNSHKIIANFASDLDVPYLTQRSLLENPEEAEEHLVALVAAELNAILEEKNVRKAADIESIQLWIDDMLSQGNKFILENTTGQKKELNKELLIDLLENGLSKVDESKYGLSKNEIKQKSHKIKLSQMYQGNRGDKQDYDDKFAQITSFRSFYGKPVPRLNLGTVIKKTDTSEYFICIQPRCDCVRITEKRRFLFIPLKVETGDIFNIILNDTDNYIRLIIEKMSKILMQLEFDPAEGGNNMIVSSHEAGKFYFKDSKGIRYQWIGELRSENAISLANEFASELSRVGLAQSEWLRRHAK